MASALQAKPDVSTNTYNLVLKGPVPSKKNNYRSIQRRGVPGLIIRHEVKAMIAGLQLQANSQWKREPLRHPQVWVKFYCSTARIDRDGMATTVFDILQQAKIIPNDNIRDFNGIVQLLPAVLCPVGEERVEITLQSDPARNAA